VIPQAAEFVAWVEMVTAPAHLIDSPFKLQARLGGNLLMEFCVK